MECQPSVDVDGEPSPSSATPSPEAVSEEPSEPSEPVRMKKPRAPRKKKEPMKSCGEEELVQPLLDPLFWAALLNTHHRMLKSKKQDKYTSFRIV